MSLFSKHLEQWKNCTRCRLAGCRKQTALYRGSIPCEVLYVGEAPGLCISGDTFIDTAFRDKSIYPHGVPVKDLVGKSGFKVYSYDILGKKLTLGRVKKVWKTGRKKVYLVRYFWWGAKPSKGIGGGKIGGRQKYFNEIKVTSNHPFLLRSGQYKSLDQGLKAGDNLMPFYRYKGEYSAVGVFSGSMQVECRFLLEKKLGRKLLSNEECHHDDRNKKNDSYDNLIPLTTTEHARVHGLEDNVMFVEKHRKTHLASVNSERYKENHRRVMKELFKDPEMIRRRREQNKRVAHKTSATLKEKYKDPIFYYNYLKSRRLRGGNKLTVVQIMSKFRAKFPKEKFPPTDNHEICEIKEIGFEDVYDIEVEKYHNFAAHGIFLHNSEDALGIPFCGPAGKLLDEQIKKAELEAEMECRKLWTNIVGCIPKIPDTNRKAEEPVPEEIEACNERLEEIIKIARPKVLVAVGKHASKAAKENDWCKYAKIVEVNHPAFVLRIKNPSQQKHESDRVVIQLSNVFSEWL